MIRQAAFTLLELIIVIILVGVLATLGYAAYSSTIEKFRGAEARQVLGQMRSTAIGYHMQQGTSFPSDLVELQQIFGLGDGTDQIPLTCRSSNYFRYWATIFSGNLTLRAIRCGISESDGGGKPPGYPSASPPSVTWVLDDEGTIINDLTEPPYK